MKNILAFFGSFFIFLFVLGNGAYAVTTSISNAPSTISQDPFTLTVTITGAKAAKNYLRVDIYKESTTEYKGQTYNGTDWYDGEDGTQYFPIDIVGSEDTVATVSARLNTIPASWNAQDHFFMRVRRYTASGNYTGSEADANATPVGVIIPTPTVTITNTQPSIPSPLPLLSSAPSPTPPIPPSSPSSPLPENIYITESFVAPNMGQNEWVELYNDNDHAVMLSSWYIDDLQNAGGSPKVFSTNIDAKSYAVVELSTALFNNDGDTVRLLDSNKEQKDYFIYTYSQKGKSIGRNNLDTHTTCLQEPSKGKKNEDCTGQFNNITMEQSTSEAILGETDNNAAILPAGRQVEQSSNESLQDLPTVAPTSRSVVGDEVRSPTPSAPSTSFAPGKLSDLGYLVKAGATSAAGISLVNIVYILCRMKIAHGKKDYL